MIIPGLYLGSFQAVMNTERLRRLVSTILIAINELVIYLEHLTCVDLGVPNTNRVRA